MKKKNQIKDIRCSDAGIASIKFPNSLRKNHRAHTDAMLKIHIDNYEYTIIIRC